MQAKLELSDEDDKGEKFDVMVEPLQQRYNAAAQPWVGASNIPNGWSKQMILRIYTSPALKGMKCIQITSCPNKNSDTGLIISDVLFVLKSDDSDLLIFKCTAQYWEI